MTPKITPILMLMVAPIVGNHQCQAHERGLEYTNEWQTDFKGQYNWSNLLKLNGALDLGPVRLEATTISIARTSPDRLLDDLQVFSNIDEDPLPLTFGVLGAGFEFGTSTLFVGVRNVNEDYFETPLTSFFTNSSCGIYPTLSSNYEIANYPLASMGIHYAVDLQPFKLQTSLYNGRGYKRLAGHDNIFTVNPKRDGVFWIASSQYSDNGNNYILGCALYYGVCSGDTSAWTEAQKKTFSCAPWALVEQKAGPVEILGQISGSTHVNGCRYFIGAGVAYPFTHSKIGIYANHAHFKYAKESVVELSWRWDCLGGRVYLQPAMHVCKTDSDWSCAGLMRMCLTL